MECGGFGGFGGFGRFGGFGGFGGFGEERECGVQLGGFGVCAGGGVRGEEAGGRGLRGPGCKGFALVTLKLLNLLKALNPARSGGEAVGGPVPAVPGRSGTAGVPLRQDATLI